jgi:hypothetical protein
MFSFLFSKIGAYLVGGLLIAGLLGGGYWYVNHLRTENALLTRQVAGYKRAMQIIKNDMKQDQEDQDEKDKIDALTPEQLPDEFKRLRDKARGNQSSDASNADN